MLQYSVELLKTANISQYRRIKMNLHKNITFLNLSRLAVCGGILLLTTACSLFSGVAGIEDTSNEVAGDPSSRIIDLTIEDEFEIFHSHKQVSDYTDKLAYDLVANMHGHVLSSPLAISSFVTFDKSLNTTNELGNLIAESLIGKMQRYNIAIMDVHLIGGIMMSEKGEFVFSRKMEEIFSDQPVNYVLSGMMIKNERGVTVNARILELGTQRVISSATALIPSFVSDQLN
ncbi:MAG: TolB-like protein [Oleiphilaceae bacterium]|jgi:TolB-like protein